MRIVPGLFRGSTLQGVPIYQGGGAKNGRKGFLRRRRRREKFLSTFFEIFGKFVNRDAIKSDFWGVVGRYVSKISRN